MDGVWALSLGFAGKGEKYGTDKYFTGAGIKYEVSRPHWTASLIGYTRCIVRQWLNQRAEAVEAAIFFLRRFFLFRGRVNKN